ncbi:hypothetical protein JQS43_15535 [Natronosporangium hydrolyticum]|uniref:Uncharacterized protein n=1 Tax=Natronosporangium hydrolyticum TaxID=2811111 RepID=A0A895YCJ5_9ACTN|nr:hypothetical protein [Natronosporangium hydrolyticum]QSB13059.1 hypothetical protein JQS43_15535 [Natronosporangium hydrolyticum]
MSDEKLTLVQRSVLMILMAEAREVANSELTNHFRCELKKNFRERLVTAELISARREGQRYHLELTEAGWRWGRQQAEVPVPPGLGAGGGAAYALLANVQRGLDRLGISLPEFFSREDPLTHSPANTSELAARARKAYQELVDRPGGWVRLAQLRPLLGAAASDEVDEALLELSDDPQVALAPASDQLALTDADRAAAVWIGNQQKHLISIGPE